MKKNEEAKTVIHITNNYNAPIGQHIDHADTINFSMDGNGEFHFGKVENAKTKSADKEEEQEELTTEKKFRKCIDVLIDERVLINKYDYTWVMEASNQTNGMPHFNTPSSFIDYIENIGIGWLPSEDSINRKQNKFSGKFPEWTFTDCDTTEANRRINVGKRFLNVYRGL